MNQVPNNYPETGYMIVKVTTARGAIPLEGAAVIIRSEELGSTDVLYSLTTDASGQTPRVSLPAPSRASSESPGNSRPFATYSIDVAADGYLPQSFSGVPVFSAVLSIQPAVMLPTPEGSTDLRYPPTAGNAALEDPYGHL